MRVLYPLLSFLVLLSNISFAAPNPDDPESGIDQRRLLSQISQHSVNSWGQWFSVPSDTDEDGELKEISYYAAFKKTALFIAPYFLSKIAITANGMWNGSLYQNLGPAAIAAKGLISTTEFLVMGAAMAAMRSISLFTGKLNNSSTDVGSLTPDQKRALGNVNKAATATTLAYTLGIATPIFLNAGNILTSMGMADDPAAADQAQRYFNGFFWGAGPTLLMFGDEQFAMGLGDSHIPLIYGTLYAVIASVCAYPLSQNEDLGVEGIGHAMSIGATAAWLALRTHYAVSEKYKEFDLWNYCTLKFSALKHYVTYASNFGLSSSLSLLTDWLYAQMILHSGSDAGQAYGASLTLFEQWTIALISINSGSTALVANKDPSVYAEGSDEREIAVANARKYGVASTALSVLPTAVFSASAGAASASALKTFGGNLSGTTLSEAQTFYYLQAAKTTVTSVLTGFQGVLHGLKDVTVPFAIDTASSIVTLGIAAAASYAGHSPEATVAASLIGESLATVAYGIRSSQVYNDFTIIAQETSVSAWESFRTFMGLDIPEISAFG